MLLYNRAKNITDIIIFYILLIFQNESLEMNLNC